MSFVNVAWIICGIIWALVIIGFFALVIVNRIRNIRGRDD